MTSYVSTNTCAGRFRTTKPAVKCAQQYVPHWKSILALNADEIRMKTSKENTSQWFWSGADLVKDYSVVTHHHSCICSPPLWPVVQSSRIFRCFNLAWTSVLCFPVTRYVCVVVSCNYVMAISLATLRLCGSAGAQRDGTSQFLVVSEGPRTMSKSGQRHRMPLLFLHSLCFM